MVQLCPPCRRAADPLITDHALYWALGNTPFQREAAYIDLVEQGIGADELMPDQLMPCRKGWPLAARLSRPSCEQTTKRQVLPAKRGRPFKIKSR